MGAVALIFFGAALLVLCGIGSIIEWFGYENRRARHEAREMRRSMR